MRYSLIVFISVFVIFSVSAQTYKKISLKINSPQDFNTLIIQEINLEHAVYSKSDNTLSFFVTEEEFTRLMVTSLEITVLIDDWNEYYNNLPVPSDAEKEQIIRESKNFYNVDGFGFGSMGGFYTYAEIGANLDSMHAQYPNLITQKTSIGISHNGHNIWAVKISDNPDIPENEPAVGMDALIHAREPQSMATLMYFMWYLLENYGTNPEVTYIVNNREIYCVPCFNPDGYEYNRQTNPNGGGMWRKNRRNNSASDGVDLNRNYSYKWGYDNIGSSPTPSSETYRGPSPASEPETQAVTNYISPKNIKAHFNMHSGADAYLYPWGYINQACPDYPVYEEYCQDMVAFNGYEYGTGGQVLGYVSNGSARDWLYGEQTVKNKIFGYTYEIGPFWPVQSQIIPIAQKNVKALLYHTWISGEYIKLKNAAYNVNYFNPGDNVEMTATFLNKGQSDGINISVTLTSLSSIATIINGNNSFPVIESRTEATTSIPYSFIISPLAQANEEIKLVLTMFSGSDIMNADTLKFIVGTPSFLMNDTTNVITQMWTITASPANPQWGITTSSYYSAPNSYTDSPSGNYTNNATVTLTLKNAVDLSAYPHARLSFWTKYDFEAGWDYGQVEVSTNNGSTWIPLSGKYTLPGSGSFQPPNQPLYNGTRTTWVREEMSLAGYTSSQVKVRFKLRSDGATVRDGWYIDDIGIFYYTIIPVELSSFTAYSDAGMVTINWITSSELNNKGFEVWKSKPENNSEWDLLTFIPGNGTSTETHSYNYIDRDPGYGRMLYRLKQIDYDGSFKIYGPIEANNIINMKYALEQNYPNPFNPSTTIRYGVAGIVSDASSIPVSIKLYDILGNELITLVQENKPAGEYELEFNGSGFASGIYYYTMKSGDFIKTRKLILLK